MIVPSKFAKNEYGKELRKLIADQGALERFIHLGDAQVFGDATNYTCLLFLRKNGGRNSYALGRIGPANTTEQIAEAVTSLDMPSSQSDGSTSVEELDLPAGNAPWLLLTGTDRRLHQRLTEDYPTLGSISTNVFTGIQTSADYIYHVRRAAFARWPDAVSSVQKGTRTSGRSVDGTLERVGTGRHEAAAVRTGRGQVLPESDSNRLPAVPVQSGGRKRRAYTQLTNSRTGSRTPGNTLTSFEDELRSRESGKMDHEGWYAFGRNQRISALHDFPKLAVPATCFPTRAAYFDSSSGRLLPQQRRRLGGVLLSQFYEMRIYESLVQRTY